MTYFDEFFDALFFAKVENKVTLKLHAYNVFFEVFITLIGNYPSDKWASKITKNISFQGYSKIDFGSI